MPLSDAQRTTMGYLGTIQAAIGKVDPVMKNTVVDFWGFGSSDAQNLRTNTANFTNGGTPFGFLVNLFQMLGSYDEMIEWLTNFLVKSLPALEVTIKGVLLSNLRNMMTCNLDPRIPEIYRKDGAVVTYDSYGGNGIYVNIGSIDFANILAVSPLTEEGSQYYFGTYSEIEDIKVKKDFKNYTEREKFNFITSFGKKTADTEMTVKKKSFVNIYSLARAFDFNAFLWFVIHKGKLALPLNVVIDDGESVSDGIARTLKPDGGDEDFKLVKLVYDKKKGEYDESQAVKMFGSAFKAYNAKPITNGTTMTVSFKNNSGGRDVQKLVQMAFGATTHNFDAEGVTEGEASGTLIDCKDCNSYTVNFAPISDDLYSVNWYADPSNYYAYNLSLPKSKRPQKSYNDAKPICNIKYMNQGRSYDAAENHRLLVSILPKPFCTYSYNMVDKDSLMSAPFINKILFDEDGKPSKKGHFSLRNYTENGEPYVRAIMESLPEAVSNMWLNKIVSKLEYSETSDSGITSLLMSDEMSNNYKFFASISDYARKTLNAYSQKLKKMYLADDFTKKFKAPENGMSEGLKEKYKNAGSDTPKIYFLQTKDDILYANGNAEKFAENCVRGKYTKEDMMMSSMKIDNIFRRINNILNLAQDQRTNQGKEDYFRYDRFKVGYTDDCMLYVDRHTGKYTLGSSTLGQDGKPVQNDRYNVHLQECYAGITVYEFNYDLIMGMKLFDARVLANSLVNALFNLSVGVGVSVNPGSIFGNEETAIIRSIITDVLNSSDDTEITDCFFTFSNEKYEDLISRAEKKYLNTGTIDNPSLRNVKINTKPLQEILDEYDENGTINEQTEVISRFFKKASTALTEDAEDMTETDRDHVQVRFATNLIGALAGVLIEAILTPKVMLAYQINREMVGGDVTDYHNFKEFLGGMKMLIVAMVREIRDIIMKELMNMVMSLLNKLIMQFGVEILKEQMRVFKELLAKLIKDCAPNIASLASMFKRAPRSLIDTTLPVVEYADILANTSDTDVSNEGTEPLIDKC